MLACRLAGFADHSYFRGLMHCLCPDFRGVLSCPRHHPNPPPFPSGEVMPPFQHHDILTPQATSRWTAPPPGPSSPSAPPPDRNATNAADSGTLPVPALAPMAVLGSAVPAGTAVVRAVASADPAASAALAGAVALADRADRADSARGRGCRRSMRMGRLSSASMSFLLVLLLARGKDRLHR